MRTVERLAQQTAKALSLGLRRGVKTAIKGQKKATAVRGGAKIRFLIDGNLVAEFDKNGAFTGNLDIKLSGPIVPQLPAVGGEVGAGGGYTGGYTRGERLDGDERVEMEIWCEYSNMLAIDEDEDNFGQEDADEWDANA